GLPGERTLSNSAGVLWHPAAHRDWVRPGTILYGASPTGVARDIADTGLLPSMTLSSRLIGIQTIEANETVGYGRRFAASSAMRVGVVACGYADGYPRHAPRRRRSARSSRSRSIGSRGAPFELAAQLGGQRINIAERGGDHLAAGLDVLE
ncbi:alanine racemase C-terminal domain-containing protein, partial [Burkholderia cepacia]|uniref:alanine racemase C-terminal domain-containing protein n=1 Tax=Burkholderia cepacia TaxID=292 RepID=UPI00313314F4